MAQNDRHCYSVYVCYCEPLLDHNIAVPSRQSHLHDPERKALHLVIDGTEGTESRGLLVLSALTFVARALTDLPIVVLAGDDPVVHTAASCLRWDTGLRVDLPGADLDPSVSMQGALLFVAVAFRSAPSQYLAAASQAGISTLLPVQFPEDHAATPSVMALVKAAHDPATLGAAIISKLGRRV
jgi:hypothetical protein